MFKNFPRSFAKIVSNRGPIRLPSSYMLILCSMHINCRLLDALLKNPVALKVLVRSRGRLVTLQILTSSSFSLVEGTHGSSGQCVSFSLIDVGSDLTAYVVFLFSYMSNRGLSGHPCFSPRVQRTHVVLSNECITLLTHACTNMCIIQRHTLRNICPCIHGGM